MIYFKQMAIQRIASIYNDLWSAIRGPVQCIVTAVRSLHYNTLNRTIFILYLNYSTLVKKMLHGIDFL